MISSLKHTFIIITVFFLNIEMYICTCARAEYEINGECCPMCPPGSRVFRHCTEFTSTTCKHCVGLTYTDEPNGLANCISCTVCDAGQGLRVKAACTWTSDTVCEPLEGFYCTDEYRGSCRYAVEHTKCSPGQYIKQKGTALKDAECAECSDGTYSNGSLLVCKPHSTCEDFGLTEIKPGTNSLDTEYGKTPPVALIIGALLGLTAVVAVAGALFFIKRCRTCPPRGTKASDTVCEPCSPGFYSPEGVNCSKWTDCSARNEIKDEEGTSIRDVQCKPRNRNMRYGFIAVLLTAAVAFLLLLVVLYLKYRLEIKSTRILNSPVEETGPQTSVFAPSTSPLAETQETESPDCQPDSNKEHLVHGDIL